MTKHLVDLTVKEVTWLNEKYALMKLTDTHPLPEMLPGQFVEVRADHSSQTMLRRPISIHFVDREHNELWLLVAVVGDGTHTITHTPVGGVLNCMLSLGNGFTLPTNEGQRWLLTGGGVGVAPLLYLGAEMKKRGIEPTFLLGARKASDLLQLQEFEKYGRVLVTTEDGSAGEKGFVTNHSVLDEHFDHISCCGPLPMMKAVARYAAQHHIACEVSLENQMACGIGACLCCVEKTQEGNVCVCKEGPVFDINRLTWQN